MECCSVPIPFSFFVIFDMLALTCGGYGRKVKQVEYSEETVKLMKSLLSHLTLDSTLTSA